MTLFFVFDPEDTNGHSFVQLTAQYQEVAALNASVYAAKEATRQVIAESQPVVATLQVCTEKRARANLRGIGGGGIEPSFWSYHA